jgi:hypothetical protein
VRQLLAWRTWAALAAVIAATIVLATGVLGGGESSSTERPRRNVDTTASVMAWEGADAWTTADGASVGAATLLLDDGRRVVITDGTAGEASCADRSTPAACVLLADTLGPAVVWFAVVPADDPGLRVLTLPTLVDMVDDGDRGVLANDWIVPLTNGVVRTCAGEETTRTLRQFIERYAGRGIRTILDIDRDEIVEVVCAPVAG